MRLTRLVAPFAGIGTAGKHTGAQWLARHGVRHPIPRQRGSTEFEPRLAANSGSAVADSTPGDKPTSDRVIGLYLLGPLIASTVWAFQRSLVAALDLTPPPPLALILDLRGTTSIDDDGCGALRDVRAMLRPEPTQLHLAAGNGVHERLECTGLIADLGTDGVHDSARTAVLAAYASLPGPGVATARVRQALREPFQWLELS